MPTFRIDLAYDGSGFHGYAKQPNQRTVQGELESALRHMAGDVTTVVAGRTDAGVHARNQVVSFVVDRDIEATRLLKSLNALLSPEIAVWSCAEVDDDFDARFSALWRSYRYRIDNGRFADPLRRTAMWHVRYRLDLEAMNEAAQLRLGGRDFASFCRPTEGRSTERVLLASIWRDMGGSVLEFEIAGSSFCRQMVRSLVAFDIEVGRGRIAATDVTSVLAARDRRAGSGAAPPQGLVLWDVGY